MKNHVVVETVEKSENRPLWRRKSFVECCFSLLMERERLIGKISPVGVVGLGACPLL